jgi:DNA-damage-inducible protein J
MPATAEFRVTIDEKVMEEASAIYAEAGLTLSDAVQMLLRRTVADQALPMELWSPNAETLEAMDAARRGDVATFRSVEELMADLNADD